MTQRQLLNWLLYPVRNMVWREVRRVMRRSGLL